MVVDLRVLLNVEFPFTWLLSKMKMKNEKCYNFLKL